jgi:hypothetical protein
LGAASGVLGWFERFVAGERRPAEWAAGEGIQEFSTLTARWEAAICMVSGFVAGMLLGYNGYVWCQSVIVEVYSFSLASFMVVVFCLLRWIYAPHQRRFLYYALWTLFHKLPGRQV